MMYREANYFKMIQGSPVELGPCQILLCSIDPLIQIQIPEAKLKKKKFFPDVSNLFENKNEDTPHNESDDMSSLFKYLVLLPSLSNV